MAHTLSFLGYNTLIHGFPSLTKRKKKASATYEPTRKKKSVRRKALIISLF